MGLKGTTEGRAGEAGPLRPAPACEAGLHLRHGREELLAELHIGEAVRDRLRRACRKLSRDGPGKARRQEVCWLSPCVGTGTLTSLAPDLKPEPQTANRQASVASGVRLGCHGCKRGGFAQSRRPVGSPGKRCRCAGRGRRRGAGPCRDRPGTAPSRPGGTFVRAGRLRWTPDGKLQLSTVAERCGWTELETGGA